MDGTESPEPPNRVPIDTPVGVVSTPEPARTPPHAPYIYALGHIEPRFPSLGVEKEFAQAVGRGEPAPLTDREVLQSALMERRNRYLARQLCWVFTIEGLDTYILLPRDPLDLDLLVESVRAHPTKGDLDVIIGVRGPLAEPDQCNGLVLPLVAVDQSYAFEREELFRAIPRPDDVPEDQDEQFRATVEELFNRILQLADNAGATDEHRAVNYLAVRYPAIYAQTAVAHRTNGSLNAVEVRPSRLSASRTVVDVIFSYTNRQTDVTEKYFVRVDVTEEFPFLVTKLSPYYDR